MVSNHKSIESISSSPIPSITVRPILRVAAKARAIRITIIGVGARVESRS